MMKLDSWLDLLEQRHPQEIELGLERCGVVFKRLGSPRPAKKVFTVAGTNGKGSTVAYLAAISAALGQRYGTYTSPHVFKFNERICIMGEAVSDERLVTAFEQVESARGDVSLTYFEFTTLAAFVIMQQSELECAILEVGLGGRLDTVNLIDADCAVITPIGLDHQDFLGPDLSSIATEKAGVLRAGKVVVCTEKNPPPEIMQTAAKLQTTVLRRDVDFELADDSDSNGQMLKFSMAGDCMRVPYPSMSGEHQLQNLAAALAAMALDNPVFKSKMNHIGQAIIACQLPGRLQIVSHSPNIILDVGHNALAAEVVAAYLSKYTKTGVTCVLAMMADKNAEQVATALDQSCDRWICADSHGPRGQSSDRLAARVQAVLPAAEVLATGGLDDAMVKAVSTVNEDEIIFVFGSFTTVSAAANWLENGLQRDGHDAARITSETHAETN